MAAGDAVEPAARDEIVSVVIGTAGHIDHGKSSLVKRLTGIDPDRLKEEQERGLTIDLGFAPLRLRDGRVVGMIDVPGHERFVKNMVAGATGVDLVLLVVAADDGVMPQTREHLEILGLLGLQHGIVVVSKADLADDELLGVLELELADLLRGTFLERAPVVRVSAHTGQGLDALMREVERAVAGIAPRAPTGAFRMPVQRVFSAQGFGTVLTGVPLEGTLAVGEQVEVLTGRGGVLRGRVRSLQAYGRKVERVRAGHSSAVNVVDVDRRDVERGDSVCAPGVFAADALVEARITYLASRRRPLAQRETVRVHIGTAEVLGEVVVLDRREVAPGETALCQLRLRAQVVAVAGDRFVLRRHSPMETLGGGVVLGTSPWRLKPLKGFVLERLGGREEALGDLEAAALLELGGEAPQRQDDLVRTLRRPREEVERLLAGLAAAGRVVEVSGGKGQPAYVTAERFAQACARLEDALGAYHVEHPFRAACPRAELRARAQAAAGSAGSARAGARSGARGGPRSDARGADAALAAALQAACTARLVADGRVREVGAGYARAGHEVVLGEAAARLADGLRALYHERAFQPPTLEQALAELAHAGLGAGLDSTGDSTRDSTQAHDVAWHLVERGDLVAVGDELVFHRDRYAEARSRVEDEIRRHGPLAAGAFKDLLGSSRRYAIPLLEHFDEVGLTRRQGDLRVLRAP